jgi:hypothetical protein
MLKSKTVFVLGAGASSEVDLPVGSGLAKTISKKLDIRYTDDGHQIPGADWNLYSTFRGLFQDDRSACHRAARKIADGIKLANSIDEFLDRHRSDKMALAYGKLAIV